MGRSAKNVLYKPGFPDGTHKKGPFGPFLYGKQKLQYVDSVQLFESLL
ncbi:hypothetical protein NB714_002858 [Pantoea dispersa]|nr:hypothetical protein [Pantoea dispersa]MCW0326733.1 hypothetical protein [Pantoea dispersa]MCW0433395.1 hypothetical protein [Pantoea dispersa]